MACLRCVLKHAMPCMASEVLDFRSIQWGSAPVSGSDYYCMDGFRTILFSSVEGFVIEHVAPFVYPTWGQIAGYCGCNCSRFMKSSSQPIVTSTYDIHSTREIDVVVSCLACDPIFSTDRSNPSARIIARHGPLAPAERKDVPEKPPTRRLHHHTLHQAV
jgi:hypothetical protein